MNEMLSFMVFPSEWGKYIQTAKMFALKQLMLDYQEGITKLIKKMQKNQKHDWLFLELR